METVSKQTDAFTQYTHFILQGHWKRERITPLFLSFYLSHALMSLIQMHKKKKTYKLSSPCFLFLANFSRLFLNPLKLQMPHI